MNENARKDTELLFCDQPFPKFFESRRMEADAEVEKLPVDNVKSADLDELCEHVFSRFEIQPLSLREDEKKLWDKEHPVFEDANANIPVPGFQIRLEIPFDGTPGLFRARPSVAPSATPHGKIEQDTVYTYFYRPATALDEEFKSQIEDHLEKIRQCIALVNDDADGFNSELKSGIREAIIARRSRLEELDNFLSSLRISLHRKKGAPELQLRRRNIRPLPPAKDNPRESYIRDADYDHILRVIRHEGCSFEATPKTMAKFDEEELRDLIVAHLNGHYEGMATGETFRKKGKTDIRIEFDNRAAFVGECKFWRGEKQVGKTLEQLLKYVTWKDTRSALLVFNKKAKRFQSVQKKLLTALRAHPNFIQQLSCHFPSEARLEFRSVDDPDRRMTVHVFCFNLNVASS